MVQPTSHAEVQTVVRFARDRGMPIAVRGGGHDWAGRSLLDDGVVIDMSLMRRVVVDQGASLATLAARPSVVESVPVQHQMLR